MKRRVAIVGIGQTPCTYDGDLNRKELTYLATKQSLEDAGIGRQDVHSAITAQVDLYEGASLCQQYTLDSVGGAMKACDQRVGEDGIYALFAGYMEAACKPGQIVVVASVEKSSDRDPATHPQVTLAMLDTAYVRQVCSSVPNTAGVEHCLAAMQARRYMHLYGVTETQIAKVAVKNLNNAMRNPWAQNGKTLNLDEVLNSKLLSWPLRSLMVSHPGDGACALVLASEELVSELTDKPVWIRGLGWCSDVNYPGVSEWGKAKFINSAARQAYSMAGIKHPAKEIDLAEVYDNFSFNELQHCEALGLCGEGQGGRSMDEGVFELSGSMPVNPSGGLLGHGNPLGTAGLMRVAQAALQLRGEAGKHQVPGAEVAIAQGCQWPYRSGGVTVLSKW